jgi:hypothetical protein
MTYSAAERRPNESPRELFPRREWIALLLICLLAVVIRAFVMTMLPSILHPDEIEWLEQANRLVNHQGLTPFWDFQLGARSWLWPGLLAVFLGLGQLFGSPPSAGLAGRRRPALHHLAGAGDLRLPLGPQHRGLRRRADDRAVERRLV